MRRAPLEGPGNMIDDIIVGGVVFEFDGVDETVVVVDVVVDADVVGSGGAATTDCTVEIDAPRPFLARDSGPVTMSKEIGPVPGGAAL